jgi:hypothetical protein
MTEFREQPHMDEYRLYISDHRAWVRYSAEKWRRRMEGKTEAEKRSAWNNIPETVRAELMRMKREAA